MFFEVRDSKIRAESKSQDDMSGFLHAYITSFICTGSPNSLTGTFKHRPEWESYKRSDAKIMVFGKDNTEFIGGSDVGKPAVMERDEFTKTESEFWWSRVELSQQ